MNDVATIACDAAIELDNLRLNRSKTLFNLVKVNDWMKQNFSEDITSFLDPKLNTSNFLVFCKLLKTYYGNSPAEITDVIKSANNWIKEISSTIYAESYNENVLRFCLYLSKAFAASRSPICKK